MLWGGVQDTVFQAVKVIKELWQLQILQVTIYRTIQKEVGKSTLTGLKKMLKCKQKERGVSEDL